VWKGIHNKVVFIMALFCFFFGMLRPSWGAVQTDLGGNVTELSLNGVTWSYGEPPLAISVTAGEDVHTQIVLYYTKHEWVQMCEEEMSGGSLTLTWKVPDGVSFHDISSRIKAQVDGEEISIGRLHLSGASFRASVDAEHARSMAENDNIEIRIEAAMEFESGSYDLGTFFEVTAGESGESSARWNNYSLTLSKIDQEDSSRLLAGAHFSIDIAAGEEGSRQLGEYHQLLISEDTFLDNGSFLVEGNEIVTQGDQKVVLQGVFEPGNVYQLRETQAPIGYLPSDEELQFAFYRYTDSEKIGTVKRIQELNQLYASQYAQMRGFVRVFGAEDGEPGSGGAFYVNNSQVPEIQIVKKDAQTGLTMEGVAFTLQADASAADYTAEQYQKLPRGGWSYDASSGLLSWTMETDSGGMLRYPAGTVPYISNGSYTLVETVPEGYAASGENRTLAFSFQLTRDGTIELADQSGGERVQVEYSDSGIQITVFNSKAARLEINKVNQAGEFLADAEFALYGAEPNGSEDVLTADGKSWYYMDAKITDENGRAYFYDLPFGTYYLVEKKAPEGYAVLSSPYQVELKAEDVSGGSVTVTILNTVELVMPDMGAGGTSSRAAAAFALLLAGAGYVFAVRRSRCEGRSRTGETEGKSDKRKPDGSNGEENR
ncbi:MAG: SpaA isopeptide-forming pilin-related protein, partial [Lachnospiraceae bacterium]|nr:SpaA isopeptide-forming pilin-related protein [Lachnospiraceae bacterium]